jgi:hypothetical protein
MSPAAIALAVFNAGRPAGIAAVYALLQAPRPQRLLAAYVCVGATWSAGVGILLVSVLHGANVGGGDSTVNDMVDLLGGVALLGFAAGLASGRLGSPHETEPPGEPSALERRLRRPSLPIAAVAGILTHLPGLFYLLGLNAILEQDPGFVTGVVSVLVFNAIWFSLPIAALVMSARSPERTRERVGRLTRWGRRHGRSIVTALSFVVGAYFTAKGAIELIG